MYFTILETEIDKCIEPLPHHQLAKHVILYFHIQIKVLHVSCHELLGSPHTVNRSGKIKSDTVLPRYCFFSMSERYPLT